MSTELRAASTRVPRPALAGRIARGLEAGAVLITAPAGYGKTHALEEALALRGTPAAWVFCGARHRDPGRLLLAIMEALRRVVPGLTDVALDDLRAPGDALDALGTARWLLGEVDALLVDPLVLVIDDAEHVLDAPHALAVVDGLLQAGPERTRVAVSARRRPELRLARLKAAGRVTELGEGDLTFSPQECAALLELRLGRTPTAGEVDRAMARTLGWPLGLALGATDGDAPAPGTESDLHQYFDEEVLDGLEPELRAAALDSGLADELTPRMAGALGLPEDFAQRAGRVGLFLRPVAERPDTLGYHPLFREFLRRAWRSERPPDARREVLARVAAAHEEEGRRVEAIEAWLAADRPREALAAIFGDAIGLLRSSPDAVRGWLERLPEAARREPLAELLIGYLEAGAGNPEAGIVPLRAAIDGLDAAGDVGSAWIARVALLEALYWSGHIDEMPGLAEGFDHPALAPLAPLPAAAACWEALGRASTGDRAAAHALMERVQQTPSHEALTALVVILDFYVAAPAGGHEAIIERLWGLYEALGHDRAAQQPEHLLSVTAFLLADIGRAERALEIGALVHAEAERSGIPPFMNPLTHILRAWLLTLAGRPADAELVLAAVEGVEPPRWPSAFAECARAAGAHARGDDAEALGHASRALRRVGPAPVQFRSLLVFSLAPVVAAAGEPDRALDLVGDALDGLEVALPGDAGRYHRARGLALAAWLLNGDGELEAAAGSLRDAFASAGAFGHDLVRVEWPRLRDLTWDLLEAELVEPDLVLEPARRAFSSGRELLAFAEHPRAAVRAAVIPVLGASGHPQARTALKALASDDDAEVAGPAKAALEQGQRERLPLTFRCFGGFELRRGDWPVEERDWGRPTVARLVRFLLVHRNVLVPEELLLEAFWPEKAAKSARSALQVAVSRARAILDPPGAETSAVQFAERSYRLVLHERDRVDVDVFAFTADAALAEHGPIRGRLLERAAELWTGEPLPEDRYADWSQRWREELAATYGRVLTALAELHRDSGEHAAAIDVASRLLALDPLDEGAHRTLIAAYARAGRRAQALRQYLECRRLLVDELGLEPDAETVALQRKVLAGEPV